MVGEDMFWELREEDRGWDNEIVVPLWNAYGEVERRTGIFFQFGNYFGFQL